MSTAPVSQVLHLAQMTSYQEGSVVSRQITKADAGNVTLFAFDKDQGLSEHTAPFDALVHILEGRAETPGRSRSLRCTRVHDLGGTDESS